MSNSKPISFCQICDSNNLTSKLFLGYVPPVNTMPIIGQRADEEPSFPLELFRCEDCGHVQIGHEVSPEVLFPYSYPYLSGSTKILRDNFINLRDRCLELNLFEEGSLVIDIGSNDGTLLTPFNEAKAKVLGIEPSKACEVANSLGIETLNRYFNADTVELVLKNYGKARLITAANVFAHIPNPHQVVDSICDLMDDQSVFISESHYLLDLLETNQYDTIYHEHLRYYHLDSLRNLFSRHGLEIFRCEKIPTHGGSIRVFACKKGTFQIDESVSKTLDIEEKKGLLNGTLLSNFRDKVINSKVSLYSMLQNIKLSGQKIYGIGAPSRASTLINYLGLDDGIIECVMEVSSSHKLNKYMPGTRIPVLDEALLYEKQPPYVMMLSWHIAEDLIKILKKKGYKGKYIIPLPDPYIVD